MRKTKPRKNQAETNNTHQAHTQKAHKAHTHKAHTKHTQSTAGVMNIHTHVNTYLRAGDDEQTGMPTTTPQGGGMAPPSGWRTELRGKGYPQ